MDDFKDLRTDKKKPRKSAEYVRINKIIDA